MPRYTFTFTLTKTIKADNQTEACIKFVKAIREGIWDSGDIDIKEEKND